jgi:hypothetical protein
MINQCIIRFRTPDPNTPASAITRLTDWRVA